VPYADSLANGSITLCDNTGHPVHPTGGVNDVPLSGRAVASSGPARAAPSIRPGRTATHLRLPAPGRVVAPQEWNANKADNRLVPIAIRRIPLAVCEAWTKGAAVQVVPRQLPSEMERPCQAEESFSAFLNGVSTTRATRTARSSGEGR